MQVLLENIAFNHDPDLSKTGSFFLRRNETQTVPIPEWRNECCSNPECAPAGYVISQLPGTMTIKASFRCDDKQATSINVQALEITTDGPSILGAVAARAVPLQNGCSGLVEFNLPNARDRIMAAGVSASDVTWQWQFSSSTEPWTDFQTTEHRIYSVAYMPNKPWNPTSNSVTDIQVPWTEVLDHACAWAAGLTQQSEIAEAITRNVYQLGQEQIVHYGGGASYIRGDELFDCTAFLQLLKRRIGNGATVNCDDCATFVSTFSNILGCFLFQSDMVGFIITNPILLIGDPKVQSQTFSKHAVAWELNCDASAPVFDACLQVDTDGTPGDRVHKFDVSTGLVFDNGKANSYLPRFFAVGTCEPKPDTKKQRPFGSGLFGQSRLTDETYRNFLKQHYKFDDWDNHSESPGRRSDNAFVDWNSRKERRLENEIFSSGEALLKRSNSSRELVEITIYETKSPADPKDLLLQLLGSFEPLNFERRHDIGDVSFVAPGDASVLFKRDKFAVAVRSVGLQQTPVKEMAAAIDFNLQQHLPGLPNTFADLLNQRTFPDKENNMETKTYERKEEIVAINPHKLAHKWSVHLLRDGPGQQLTDAGKMDFENMDTQGVLAHGTHVVGTANKHIEANATLITLPDGTETHAVVVREKDSPRSTAVLAVYKGVLLRDKNNEMTIVGRFKLNPEPGPILGVPGPPPGQDEGTWVITKP